MDLAFERMPQMSDVEASAFWDQVTEEMMEGEDDAARRALAAGFPIYYSELDTPDDLAIKEYPDGRRELVQFVIGKDQCSERLITNL